MRSTLFIRALRSERGGAHMLATMAMLAALSVVLSRLIIPMPNIATRYSLEAVPIILAGLLFGPIPGALVAFVEDLVGCLFSGYGYNPILAVSPMLIGAFCGALRWLLWQKRTFLRTFLSALPGFVLGSVLWQSYWLAALYGRNTFSYYLLSRSLQFAVTSVLDALLAFLILRSSAFSSLGLWPPKDVDIS